MNHPKSEIEAEKLLGGYATGTLTEHEKAELFEAALEHQELFDALVDEEALRELLADPKVREQLLEKLEEEPRVVPFWRRPAVLGVAAGLMLLVTTTIMIRHQPELGVVNSKPSPKSADPAPTQKAPEVPVVLQKAQTQSIAPPSLPYKKIERKDQPAPERVQEAKQQQEQIPAKEEAPGRSVARSAPAAPLQAALAGNSAAAGGFSKAASLAPQSVAPAVKSVDKSIMAEIQSEEEAPSKNEKAKLARKASADQRPRLDPPVCTFEKLEADRWRLTVAWDSAGHLYLLRRRGTVVSVLSPVRTIATSQGLKESVFVFRGDGELDVYLLQDACAQPSGLPAEGPVDGYRRRLVR